MLCSSLSGLCSPSLLLNFPACCCISLSAAGLILSPHTADSDSWQELEFFVSWIINLLLIAIICNHHVPDRIRVSWIRVDVYTSRCRAKPTGGRTLLLWLIAMHWYQMTGSFKFTFLSITRQGSNKNQFLFDFFENNAISLLISFLNFELGQ